MALLKDEKKVENKPDDIMDIDLSVTAKKRFRINGDDSKILYLNTSDMLVLDRFRETYPKLAELAQEASDRIGTDAFGDDEELTEDKLNVAADTLKDINDKMCEYMDYVFDADISGTCLDGGSMYDPFDGQFRFQHIFNKIFELYADNITKEYQKMSTHIKRHTQKYTNKYTGKKK